MKKICSVPGCQALASDGPRCARHSQERASAERQRKAAFDRTRQDDEIRRVMNSRRWKKLSRWYRAEHPQCEECLRQDPPIFATATCVDHKRSVRSDPSLMFEVSNLQSLCDACHSRKTAIEDSEFAGARSRD